MLINHKYYLISFCAPQLEHDANELGMMELMILLSKNILIQDTCVLKAGDKRSDMKGKF